MEVERKWAERMKVMANEVDKTMKIFNKLLSSLQDVVSYYDINDRRTCTWYEGKAAAILNEESAMDLGSYEPCSDA